MKKEMVSSKGHRMVYREGTRWNEKGMSWYMECRGCQTETRISKEDIQSILCSKCVQKEMNEVKS